jgi:hypothetical protein
MDNSEASNITFEETLEMLEFNVNIIMNDSSKYIDANTRIYYLIQILKAVTFPGHYTNKKNTLIGELENLEGLIGQFIYENENFAKNEFLQEIKSAYNKCLIILLQTRNELSQINSEEKEIILQEFERRNKVPIENQTIKQAIGIYFREFRNSLDVTQKTELTSEQATSKNTQTPTSSENIKPKTFWNLSKKSKSLLVILPILTIGAFFAIKTEFFKDLKLNRFF